MDYPFAQIVQSANLQLGDGIVLAVLFWPKPGPVTPLRLQIAFLVQLLLTGYTSLGALHANRAIFVLWSGAALSVLLLAVVLLWRLARATVARFRRPGAF